MPFDGQDQNYIHMLRDRRERAAAILRAIAKENFDLGCWFEQIESGTPPCGTIGCALGWLAFFQFEGMKPRGGAMPEYGRFYGQKAGAVLFGLSWEDSTRIFVTWDGMKNVSTVTPNEVADALLAAPFTTENMRFDPALHQEIADAV